MLTFQSRNDLIKEKLQQLPSRAVVERLFQLKCWADKLVRFRHDHHVHLFANVAVIQGLIPTPHRHIRTYVHPQQQRSRIIFLVYVAQLLLSFQFGRLEKGCQTRHPTILTSRAEQWSRSYPQDMWIAIQQMCTSYHLAEWHISLSLLCLLLLIGSEHSGRLKRAAG